MTVHERRSNMKHIAYVIIAMSVAVLSEPVVAQERQTMPLTIEEALVMGREQSLVSKENRNTMRIAYWQYRNYRADLFPSVTLDATLPSLNRSLSSYQQEDGVYKFIPNNYISEYMGLTISQAIPFTGGHVYPQSSIERTDQLRAARVRSFPSTPTTLTHAQPPFAYNQYHRSTKIEPLKYENSRQDYVASVENVNITTVTYYFDLLLAISDSKTAQQNLQTARKLYDIALARRKIGTISDDELMQIHVGLMNAEAKVIEVRHTCSEKMHALRNYLGIEEDVEIVPEIPSEKVIPSVSADMIREKAYSNNPIYNDFKVRLLEAEANVVKAKRNRGPSVQLYLSVGNTGSDRNFFNSYTRLQNRQIAEVGISIPILDWGKRKGQLELAKSQYDLTRDRIAREEQDFRESVRALTEDIYDQPELLRIYQQADSVAMDRYRIALERFTLGDISVIDINYAEQEKDNARRQYITQLYLSWLYYYNLRYITLFDFETGMPITAYPERPE